MLTLFPCLCLSLLIPGVVTKLHEDIWHTDAWIAQLEGSKKFLMYHPGQRKHLEFVKPNGEAEFVDPLRPDLIKFPTFKEASPIEGYLEKGECAAVLTWDAPTTRTPPIKGSLWAFFVGPSN